VSASSARELAADPDPFRAGVDRAAEATLHELADALVLVFDAELRVVSLAGQALQRLGDPGAYREGVPLCDALPEHLWHRIEPLLRSALTGESRSREIWTAGQRHCLMVHAGPLPSDRAAVAAPVGPTGSGAPVDGAQSTATRAAGVAVVFDVSARRRAELLDPPANTGLEEALDASGREPIGTGLLDRDGRWLLVNRALCDITGYIAEELIGSRFDGIIHPEDVRGDSEQRRRLLAGEIPALQVRERYFDAAGETVSAIVSISLVRDRDGSPLHYVVQLQDVSERRRLEQDLRGLADHDPLTGLRNRRLFAHDLKLQVARSRRYGEVAGVIVIDLDAFRLLEDIHGEQAGEEALRAVARALTRRLRETDLIARLGADQFAVLLPHIDEGGLAVVAEGLARVISACGVDIGEQVLHPSASIGFALVDAGTPSAEHALRQADRARRSAGRFSAATERLTRA
jgi:diguanylate cyclase (GGDEF)-like protein/PAS domain S-box-containing protein